jgi:hypothetical protein
MSPSLVVSVSVFTFASALGQVRPEPVMTTDPGIRHAPHLRSGAGADERDSRLARYRNTGGEVRSET